MSEGEYYVIRLIYVIFSDWAEIFFLGFQTSLITKWPLTYVSVIWSFCVFVIQWFCDRFSCVIVCISKWVTICTQFGYSSMNTSGWFLVCFLNFPSSSGEVLWVRCEWIEFWCVDGKVWMVSAKLARQPPPPARRKMASHSSTVWNSIVRGFLLCNPIWVVKTRWGLLV